MTLFWSTVLEAWDVLVKSAPYVVFGLLMAGLLKVFIHPGAVVRHLAQGRFIPVVKAALAGVPIPLCSCGVLPAGAALRRQGANKGAVTAFLIATPESGVDSIAVSYALLDPLMTVIRPVAAFCTAVAAGFAVNVAQAPEDNSSSPALGQCPVDGCCDGLDCSPEAHRSHHTAKEKAAVGLKFALIELWGDLAGWFFAGILISGMISAWVPEEVLTGYLGGGLWSMLLVLAISMPMYICATASTPIAAALAAKGASAGVALVFLLAGPATNAASITTLIKVLGVKAVVVYLAGIAIMSVVFGLLVDLLYSLLNISFASALGKAGEIMPESVGIFSALFLAGLTLFLIMRRRCRPCGCSENSVNC
ncbi:MAG TPA: SO_0444 family Cu/Zn efflux transporter [Oligoflexia bacterium]|nr:SO_0444 family Cu/Zn efflux transporter [Oligoflexia bacterium]